MPKGAVKTNAASHAKAYQTLSVTNPTAGMDLRNAQTTLPSERARTLANFALTEPGVLTVRPGWTKFSTTSLGSLRAQGAARIYLNTAVPTAGSTSFTLVAYDQAMYLQNDNGTWSSLSTTVGSTASSGVTLSTAEISFVADRDLVAAFDGSTVHWKSTNGSSWTHFGIAAGNTAPTLSTVSGVNGSLSSGEFQVSYTYKDRDLAAESNGSSSPSTITLSASTGSINVIVPNSTDAQVDAIVVYARKVTAGETVRRLASSGARTAGAANSTIVITSSAWTSANEEPTDHNSTPASGLTFGVVWKKRWWARSATVKNRLHFTQLFQPQSWPGLFYVDIPFELGDEIRALVTLGDTMLVFGATKIFIILGQTSLDFEVRPSLASEDGTFGFRSVAVLENGVVHVGANGVYIFDGTTDRLLSFDLEPAWRDLVANGNAADLQKVPCVYHSARKELRISVPRLFPTGTWGEWILDLNRTRLEGQTAWSESDRTIGGYVSWNGPEATAGNRNRLFSWHSSIGQLFEEATGTSANSSNLSASYEGPGLTLGALRARWIDARIQYEPNSGTFSIEPVVDGVSQGTLPLAIGAGLSIYGTDVYGTATYAGAGRRQAYTILPLTAEGHGVVAKLNYFGQAAFKIYGYDIGFVPNTRSLEIGE